MKPVTDHVPRAAPVPHTVAPSAPMQPCDEAQTRAIADAVWTDLLWLMPPERTVTVTVRDGRVAVELGPPGAAPEVPAH
ncbi:MAG: hypothetical protein OXC28_26075 [Defluviicoccus sp.]|nr:hypothetical protein [Defluviicoccus sp.]